MKREDEDGGSLVDAPRRHGGAVGQRAVIPHALGDAGVAGDINVLLVYLEKMKR